LEYDARVITARLGRPLERGFFEVYRSFRCLPCCLLYRNVAALQASGAGDAHSAHGEGEARR
jgi:hypothetical protein